MEGEGVVQSIPQLRGVLQGPTYSLANTPFMAAQAPLVRARPIHWLRCSNVPVGKEEERGKGASGILLLVSASGRSSSGRSSAEESLSIIWREDADNGEDGEAMAEAEAVPCEPEAAAAEDDARAFCWRERWCTISLFKESRGWRGRVHAHPDVGCHDSS